MPNTREKLIDLRQEAEKIAYNFCVGQEACDKCPYHAPKGCQEGMIADHLIANGVTFATDNNVGSKWIPVTERLPEESGEYLVFGRTFGNQKPQIWICECISIGSVMGWCNSAKNPVVTHWMPLPEAPKP